MSASLATPGSSQHSEHHAAPSQRAMRLKVLYTFDAEGKQICLARWHQLVYTQVYHCHGNTPIGVVDLRTCLNSIASASPEIVALLDRDYSVYSYDYSEESLPLQGLGMLSWIMGSGASSNAVQPQGGSRLITGRVLSPQMGLFKDEMEQLEVKMKLVPVPAIKQSDYINSMNVYNTLSKIIPGDFDASAWSAYFQANPGLVQAAANVNAGSASNNGGYREIALQAPVHHQTHVQHHPQQPIQQHPQHHQSHPPPPHPPAQALAPPAQPQRPPSPTQASIAVPPPSQLVPAQPLQPTVEENGPPKKKPRKRNPRPPAGSSKAGGKKVVAPSVASAATTPSATPLEGPPPMVQTPASDAFASPDLPRAVPVRQYAHSPLADIPTVESFATPQVDSPAVPGSSPPTDGLPTIDDTPQRDCSPEPTSPSLPTLPNTQEDPHEEMDINKDLDTLFESNRQLEQEQQIEQCEEIQKQMDEQNDQPEHQQESQGQAQMETVNDIPGQSNPPPSTQPSASLETRVDEPVNNSPMPGLQFATPADDSFVAAAPSPRNDLPTSVLVADKPTKKKRKYIRKKGLPSDNLTPSETLVEDDDKKPRMKTVDENGEEVESNKLHRSKSTSSRSDSKKDSSEKPRSQGPTTAKERIEAQLRQAVEEGKMPNYCLNCGAIETPTWRRVVIKEGFGDSEKEANVLLCNPCGLWHATKKSMRPEELWDSKKQDGPPKKPRNNRKRKATGAPHNDVPPELERNAQATVQKVSMSEPIVIDDGDDVPEPRTVEKAKTPGPENSKVDSDWNEAKAAGQRRVQSSPVKQAGTSDSPIELDNSPCPRRLLFPRTAGKAILDANETKKSDASVFDWDPVEKENFPPGSVARAKLQSPMTPKRRRLAGGVPATPERRTPRAASLRSPHRPMVTPQKKSPEKAAQVSPTTDLLNRLFSEPNNINESNNGFLPHLSSAFDSFFDMDSEDAFPTEEIMPSSPPPLFNLYEDASEDVESNSGPWSELLPEDAHNLDGILASLDSNILGAYGKTAGNGGNGEPAIMGSGGASGGLTVDFSNFFGDVEEGGKGKVAE